jgi:hypothetical protein
MGHNSGTFDLDHPQPALTKDWSVRVREAWQLAEASELDTVRQYFTTATLIKSAIDEHKERNEKLTQQMVAEKLGHGDQTRVSKLLTWLKKWRPELEAADFGKVPLPFSKVKPKPELTDEEKKQKEWEKDQKQKKKEAQDGTTKKNVEQVTRGFEDDIRRITEEHEKEKLAMVVDFQAQLTQAKSAQPAAVLTGYEEVLQAFKSALQPLDRKLAPGVMMVTRRWH